MRAAYELLKDTDDVYPWLAAPEVAAEGIVYWKRQDRQGLTVYKCVVQATGDSTYHYVRLNGEPHFLVGPKSSAEVAGGH